MSEMSSSDILTLVGAFGSAFFGALSAFYLGRLQQKRDEREKRHSALLAAQYALLSQWNDLEGTRRELLEPHRNDAQRFVNLPLHYFARVHTSVPFSDITFIANSDQPDLLQQVHLAELKYLSSIEALDLRNQRLEEFYKKARIEGRNFDFETGRALVAADPRDAFFLRRITDEVYNHVDSAVPKLLAEVEALEKFIKRNFPGCKALRIEILDSAKESTAPSQPT